MPSKSEKAAKKKLIHKKHQEQQIRNSNTEFDVIALLIESQLDTKPQVGDFLKSYVKSIRVLNLYSKVTIYPVMQYVISKVFIDFLDGHQIIVDFSTHPHEYFLYRGVDEISIKDTERRYVSLFIEKLQEFQFIH